MAERLTAAQVAAQRRMYPEEVPEAVRDAGTRRGYATGAGAAQVAAITTGVYEATRAEQPNVLVFTPVSPTLTDIVAGTRLSERLTASVTALRRTYSDGSACRSAPIAPRRAG